MLHVANGETTAILLRQAGLEGDVEDGDALWMEGPLLAEPEERAHALALRLGIHPLEYLAKARAREAVLERALLETDVVFWTEEDLHCQANLCEALRRFAPLHPGRVLVATPDGPDERLAHMAPAALARRFAAARPVAPERLRLAHRFWEALASSDPRDVERLLAEDFAAWPALHEGVVAHLRRFPSRERGLDALEQEAMEALAREGDLPFPELFAILQRSPRFWALGMTDAGLAAHLRELAPLVRLEGEAPRWTVSLTPEGRAVLDGREDGLRARALDRWVGGARVRGGRAWRWDEEGFRLVPPPRA